MTNLDSIFKSRDITLPTKVHLVKAMVFPVVMYGCESWTVKKAEHWRIDASELWCWRRLLRVPWTARRSSQSILKEISPGISLEGMMLKLKLHYFGHLRRRVDSLEKTLMLGGIEGRRRRGRQRWDGWMASLTWWTWVWVNSGSWWWTGRPGMLRFMGSQRVGHDWATEPNWTELMVDLQCCVNFFCASLARWPWVWASSGSWWWTGKPGMVQSMGSQRVGTWLSDWTELTENCPLQRLHLQLCSFTMIVCHELNYTVHCCTMAQSYRSCNWKWEINHS